MAGVMLLATGCYSYAPALSTTPAPGTEVAVILTDRGRIALNERVGPEMDQLRGRLVSSSDSNLTIAMTESVSLRGVEATWTDERISLARDHISTVRVRAFSRGRTAVVATSISAATVLFIATSGFGILDSGVKQDPTTPPVGPGPSSKVTGSLTFPFRSDF